ncbi:MAG: type II toxin-antitoxin system RelE/ParE family toxin [Pseudomonadota bacterium]
MMEIRQTSGFAKWFTKLKDRQARARIAARIDRMQIGGFGDCKPVGNGISEARIDYGPGYRIYFVQRGETLVVLLAGGDKSSQQKDIRTAISLAENL